MRKIILKAAIYYVACFSNENNPKFLEDQKLQKYTPQMRVLC